MIKQLVYGIFKPGSQDRILYKKIENLQVIDTTPVMNIIAYYNQDLQSFVDRKDFKKIGGGLYETVVSNIKCTLNIVACTPKFQNNSYIKILTTVNPTIKSHVNKNRIPIKSNAGIREWFDKKAVLGGFRVVGATISNTKNYYLQKSEHDITLFGATIEGVVQIIDSDKFASTIMQGIGAAKGFGFGMVLFKGA
jgi:hypothetical protein